VDQKDEELAEFKKENKRLRVELGSLQEQFRQIIEKEEKIRYLKSEKAKRRDIEEQKENVHGQHQQLKSVGTSSKKFSLVAFHEKLSISGVSDSPS
jgi:hypothetical protein